MMDCAIWAEAASAGLGIEPGRIAAAWRANRDASERAGLETSDIARAVLRLLAELEEHGGPPEWRGEPAELYRRLSDIAGERATRSRLWPASASGMGNALRRLAPALRHVHRVELLNGKAGADGARFWSLRRL
jgi:hypothetical protein